MDFLNSSPRVFLFLKLKCKSLHCWRYRKCKTIAFSLFMQSKNKIGKTTIKGLNWSYSKFPEVSKWTKSFDLHCIRIEWMYLMHSQIICNFESDVHKDPFQGVKFDPQTGSVLHIELARSNSRRKRKPGIAILFDADQS